MGLKEDLLLSLKGTTIEYQGKKLYVIEEIEYKNDKYLYTIDIDKAPEAEISFLKKETDKIYENVTDEKLFDVLLAQIGIKTANEEIKKLIKSK